MEPSDELYETMAKRSARFDGRYYVEIVSTGIVCFPSCRSRLPKRENVCCVDPELCLPRQTRDFV